MRINTHVQDERLNDRRHAEAAFVTACRYAKYKPPPGKPPGERKRLTGSRALTLRALIIEDEAKTGAYLRRGLSEHGWQVCCVRTGPKGLHQARTGVYDVIILDVMLPGMDGFDLLRTLRRTHDTPVIMLTARDKVDDRVRGLRGGADDYLVKPFSFLELIARLDILVRRTRPPELAAIRIGDLLIDVLDRRVSRGRRRVTLTAREFALLLILARQASQVVSKAALAKMVWDIDFDNETTVVEVAILRLRAKLEFPDEDRLIHTVRGIGYMIEHRCKLQP